MTEKPFIGIALLRGLPRQTDLFPQVLRVGYHYNQNAISQKRQITDTQICIQFSSNIDPLPIKIDGVTYTEKCPRLYLKRKGEVHEFDDPDLKISSFYFSYPSYSWVEDVLPPDIRVKKIDIAPRLHALINDISDLLPHRGEFGVCDRIDCLCYAMLQELQLMIRSGDKSADAKDEQMSKVISWLNRHFLEDFQWSELALKFGFSERSLIRHWHNCMPESPKQYVISLRMAEAERLLSETDMDIGSIAGRIGYSTEVSFSFAFRKRFGITPAAFRRKLRCVR